MSELGHMTTNKHKCLTYDLRFPQKKNFFKVFLSDTFISPILGPLVPCFGFLVTSPLGFKARVGSALFTLWRRM